MSKPTLRRGLHSMRTLASRKASASLKTPELYIRLASLEIERSRRVIERDSLRERLIDLDNRILKVTDEQNEVRARISECDFDSIVNFPSPQKSKSNNGFTY